MAAPTPPPPPGLSAAPDVMSLLSGLRRRWILAFLLGGFLACITAVAAYIALKPKETGFAQIRILYQNHGILEKTHTNPADFKTVLKSAADEIQSRVVIMAALSRPEIQSLELFGQSLDAALSVQEDLRVETKDNSELVTIYFTHADATAASKMAAAIRQAYFDNVVDKNNSARNKSIEELRKLKETTETKLGEAQKKVQEFGKSKDKNIDPVLWREERSDALRALLDLKRERTTVGGKLIEARGQLDVIEVIIKETEAQKDTEPGKTRAASASPTFDQLNTRVLEADAEYKALSDSHRREQKICDEYARRDFVEWNGLYRTARDRLANAKAKMNERSKVLAERVRTAMAEDGLLTTAEGETIKRPMPTKEDPRYVKLHLQKTIEALKMQDDLLDKQIKEVAARAARPLDLIAYEATVDEYKRIQADHQNITKRHNSEELELRAAPRISPFGEADLLRKDNKKQLMATAVAPLGIWAVVCAGLAFLEFQKRRVRNATQISRGLGIRVVGAIPNAPHLERQIVAVDADLDGTPVMESIDALRTRLLHESDTRATRVVMVTSAGPGEGKTTLASALASSLARAGRKTLILDGDLRRPTLQELFEVTIQPGFSELLLGEVEVADAALETQQENLWLLPAGQFDRDVLLALSRGGLEGIFERLEEEFDFIIVDSHPVLDATDSLLLGRRADAVILSVLREVSQMPRVYAASQQLGALGIRVLGAVVSGTDPEEVFSTPHAASVSV
jgi:capsular exopolysaccharide synthesis family protein